MMSSLVDLVLFLALVSTSVCVLAMYRKLKRFEASQVEYRQVFDRTSVALSSAGDAVRAFGTESREIAGVLGARIEEARSILSELKLATQAARQGSQGSLAPRSDSETSEA